MLRKKWRKNEAGKAWKSGPAHGCVGVAEFYIAESSDCVYNAFSWICESNRNKRDENKAGRWCALCTSTQPCRAQESRKKLFTNTGAGRIAENFVCDESEGAYEAIHSPENELFSLSLCILRMFFLSLLFSTRESCAGAFGPALLFESSVSSSSTAAEAHLERERWARGVSCVDSGRRKINIWENYRCEIARQLE